MLEKLSIKKIAYLCILACITFWMIYGIVWEISYDFTTPPLSSSHGRPVEHTIGIYIFLSLLAGVLFSIIGALITTMVSIGYVMTKVPLREIWAYKFSKKVGIAFILLALILNIIVAISPYIFNL